MQRLEREMARRRELIERLTAIAELNFLVMVEGPVIAQVPIAKAVDHVPTEVLGLLMEHLRLSAAQNLLSIARLHSSQLVDWRPGDALEELRDLDQVRVSVPINVREYGIKRLLSQPQDGAASSASSLDSADGEGSPDGKVAQVTDGDLEVGGSAGHDGLSFVSGVPSIQPGLGR